MTNPGRQPRVRLALAALAIAALVAAPACFRRPVRDYACPVADAAPPADSLASWDCNRAIIERVLRGRTFSMREYRAAAAYFERLTGIPAGSRPTRQGSVPQLDELRRAAERWDEWYDGRDDHAASRPFSDRGSRTPA